LLTAEQLNTECDEIRTRRSGPGGQHRNKTESAVVLTHRSTGISAEANERRSQHENRRVALTRLRINLAISHRGQLGEQSVASDLWQSRCTHQQIRVSTSHVDFPALVAEALDRIAACEFDIKLAAEFLSCSSSQLIKFLKSEPRALQQVNDARVANGKHRLQ
jgi:hypothetical protein